MNKRFYILLLTVFYLLCSATAFAQDRRKIDSLQNELVKFEAHKKELGNNATPLMDSLKVNLLSALCYEYWNNQSDSGMAYAQQILSLSEQIGYKNGIAKAYYNMGAVNNYKTNYPESVKYYQKALQLYEELGNKKGMAKTNYSLAGTYYSNSNDTEAVRHYQVALKIQDEIGDKKSMGDTYYAIGAIYTNEANYPEGLKYFLGELKVNEEVGNKQSIAYSYNDVGFIYSQIGNYPDALTNYLKALHIQNEIDDKEGIAPSEINIGWVYCKQKNYDAALKNEFAALKIGEQLKYKKVMEVSYEDIGLVYLQEHKYNEALKNYFSALNVYKNNKEAYMSADAFNAMGLSYERLGNLRAALEYETKGLAMSLSKNKSAIQDSYEELAIINAKLHNYKAAYDNEVLFKQYYDSIYNQENEKKLTSLQMQYDFDKKQDSIKAIETKQQDSLRTEQVKKDAVAQKEIQNQKNVLYSLLGGLLLVMGFAAFVFRSLRVSRKQKIAIEKEKQRAEQSERYKQQFLANMSHEIRTPMNAVMGMTNLLLDKNPRSDQFNYLNGIKKSSDNLLHIINDILELSKVEAGKIELEQIDFSLRETIDQVKQTLQHKAEEKGLQLLTHVDQVIPAVLVGDPARLNQVLINLAGNAIKFTEKGSVTIEVGKSAQEFGIKFSIIDTGIGIPKEKLQTVFESFSQAHSSDTRKFGGTGLGLTISKQFIELMGGTILVESEEGSGTTFSFEINLSRGSEEGMMQHKSASAIDGSILNGLRILLVEDNEYNRVVAIDTLKSKAQVEIDSATNGKEAIALLEKNNYDVVLMDVQMPEMNGYEATQKIRAEFSSPKNQIPIIALTASVIRSDLDKCREAGMNSYVAKPFNTSQLIGAIAEMTGRKINSVSPSVSKVIDEINFSVIDLNYLKNFCEGNEERMKKYINMFLEAVPPFQQKIEKAVSENDIQEIARQVHAFRPKFMIMGMKEAQQLAVNIELLCGEKENSDSLQEKISRLMKNCELSFTQLKA